MGTALQSVRAKNVKAGIVQRGVVNALSIEGSLDYDWYEAQVFHEEDAVDLMLMSEAMRASARSRAKEN